MKRYIGLDAHASSCTLAVLETNARAVIEVLRGHPPVFRDGIRYYYRNSLLDLRTGLPEA